MKKIILQMLLVIASVGFAQAQTKVTGKVVDVSGKPLDYVSVLVKEFPSAGAYTDEAGNYSISVPAGGQTLVFSFVGYTTQEVPIGTRSIINITLESDAVVLEGTVVTALGIKRTEKSTSYSVTQVGNEEITKGAAVSPMTALQGKIAGVSISSSSGAPGASTRVVLRGFSSITGSNDPLYVVDGVPVSNGAIGSAGLNNSTDYGNRFNDINTNDIESMSVLKGAAASALYGSRAANGVILVTTKSGSTKENLSVDFISNTTFSRVGRLPEMQNEFGQGWSGEYTFIENGSWGPKLDGRLRTWGNIVDGQQQYKPFKALPTNVRDFFETGMTVSNAISLHGGTANTTYFASYSNVYDNGVVPGDKDLYQRNTFSLKGSTKSKYFFTNAAVTYSNKSVSAIAGGQDESIFQSLLNFPRDISVVDVKDYNSKFNRVDNYFTPYNNLNPYYKIDHFGNTLTEDHLFGNFQVGVEALPWLTITARLGEDYSAYKRKEWSPIIKPTPGSPNDGQVSNPGRVYEAQNSRSELNGDLLIMFKPKLGNNFSVNGILGYNINMQSSSGQAMQVTGLLVPNFYHISNSASIPEVSQSTTERRLMGFFAQADLAYKNFLYLNLSAREDFSSTLPKDSRSFFYPAAGLSILFSDAFPSIKNVISYGKLRANYGVTGNDPGPYSLSTPFTAGNIGYPFGYFSFPLDGLRGYGLPNTIGNPALKPELTHEIEFGAELRFLNNAFGIDVSWYKRNTKNQILPIAAPATSGYLWVNSNIGNVQNKGWEVVLTANPVKTNDFNWNFSYTFTRNRNMVIELAEGVDELTVGGTNSLGFMAQKGMAIGYFKGVVAETTDDGRIIVDDAGIPIPSDEHKMIGESQGDYQMGFSNNISYKGFHFSFSLDFRKGGVIYSQTASNLYFLGHAPQTTFNDRNPFIVPNSVRVEDGEYVTNYTPIAVADLGTFWNQGGFLMDKSFLLSKTMIALREVVIGYTLPAKWFNNKFIKGIDINLVGNNLFLWTPETNRFIDPQVTTFGNGLESEYGEFYSAPSVRKYGFSVKLKM